VQLIREQRWIIWDGWDNHVKVFELGLFFVDVECYEECG
jgi:hypothetical protein